MSLERVKTLYSSKRSLQQKLMSGKTGGREVYESLWTSVKATSVKLCPLTTTVDHPSPVLKVIWVLHVLSVSDFLMDRVLQLSHFQLFETRSD